ncbi:hypothetical protein CWE09_10850 [Aliidiomarina minuta]|uniref:Surface lipoprotein assembly modifier C-terminal domain-containing protein n=1 Tax=Aliidiomarina minuta TaxID=880057 RepID=A0A432W4K4_9GAMM|nr:surface lipoprotein assembly modifier [Aliidiomarina minuta]RUO24364.1 hypothetical protein CWE09_10850 [Aliidiomarina minuta]
MKLILYSLLFAGALPLSLYAEDSGESPLSWSGNLGAGAEQHSNVSVTEIESTTGEADSAILFEAGLDASWALSERFTLDAGYSFSDRRFNQFSEFDLRMHLAYLDLSYEAGDYSFGANHYYADALVDSNDFLTLNQSSLYVARFIGSQVYLRAALNQVRKNFSQLTERSADSQGLSTNIFWFSTDVQRFLSLGLSYTDEDANNNEFSYQAWGSRLRLSQRFQLFSRDARMQLSGSWEERDYEGVTTLLSEARQDTQLLAEANFEVALNQRLSLVAELERGRFRSNLAIADYAETRAGLGLRLDF